jgi:hypothetical protein
VTEEFVADSDLFIYRCHDCTIYVPGSCSNVFISHCRNTEIFFGVAAATAFVHFCDRTTVRGVCGRFIASACDNLTAYVTSILQPLILLDQDQQSNTNHSLYKEEDSHDVKLKHINSPCVTFAPCNGWYKRMEEHMKMLEIDPVENHYYPPALLWSGEDQHDVFKKMDPSSFFCQELPLSYCHDPINSPSIINGSPNPLPLPKEYSDYMFKAQDFTFDARNFIDTFKEPIHEDKSGMVLCSLRQKINVEFRKWLDTTGHITIVTGLLNMDRDIEEMKLHIPTTS